jgi:hypothetical protein
MLFKNAGRRCVLLFLVALLVAFVGCDYQGNTVNNIPPTVIITSFTGHASPDISMEVGAVAFQQTIYWVGTDVDGVVVGYAYRIKDQDGTPIDTPGNSFIADAIDTPDILKGFGNGWVLHYQRGASEELDLHTTPRENRTVWTDRVFAVVNFPANENGSLHERVSSFEVVAIDNRGAISDIAVKHFYTKSTKPELTITSSKGALMNQLEVPILGQGVRIIFQMPSVFVETANTRPWYFEFRSYQSELPGGTFDYTRPPRQSLVLRDNFVVNRINQDTEPEPIWYNTLRVSEESPRIDEVVLTGNHKDGIAPALLKDFPSEGADPATVTVFEARVVDLAGVVSDPIQVIFAVDDRFVPEAMFYVNHCYALGEHHFVWQPDDNNSSPPPQLLTSEGYRFGSRFFATPVYEGNELDRWEWQVVGNELTRFTFRWGYHGEYGLDDGISQINDPNGRLNNTVLHAGSLIDYKSEIKYYYLQLNGERFAFAPLMGDQPTDPELRDWLRIPAHHEISQRIVISQLRPGQMHTLRVMVEDLQEKLSLPVEFSFRLVPPIPALARSGVLYIDNLPHNPLNATPRIEFYQSIMPDGTPFLYVNRGQLVGRVPTAFRIRDGRHMFPISFLQNFKHVIYASEDFAGNLNNFSIDSDGFFLYMRYGGNVTLVGNHRMLSLVETMKTIRANSPTTLLHTNFGFPLNRSDIIPLAATQNAGHTQFFQFVGATGTAGFDDVHLNTTPSFPDAGLRNNVIAHGAMPNVTFFNSVQLGTTPIYHFKAKDPASPPSPPHTEPYEGKIVGFRRVGPGAGTGTGTTIGFPIHYLKEESAKALMEQLLR